MRILRVNRTHIQMHVENRVLNGHKNFIELQKYAKQTWKGRNNQNIDFVFSLKLCYASKMKLDFTFSIISVYFNAVSEFKVL